MMSASGLFGVILSRQVSRQAGSGGNSRVVDVRSLIVGDCAVAGHGDRRDAELVLDSERKTTLHGGELDVLAAVARLDDALDFPVLGTSVENELDIGLGGDADNVNHLLLRPVLQDGLAVLVGQIQDDGLAGENRLAVGVGQEAGCRVAGVQRAGAHQVKLDGADGAVGDDLNAAVGGLVELDDLEGGSRLIGVGVQAAHVDQLLHRDGLIVGSAELVDSACGCGYEVLVRHNISSLLTRTRRSGLG